jgi:hypothetical protein
LANLAPTPWVINIVNGLYRFVAEGYQEINSTQEAIAAAKVNGRLVNRNGTFPAIAVGLLEGN